ncbi:hypothetical protein E3N88_17550 [Mikania micrantha]|uniref:ATP-dependent DNA helicase n=1 Tax=Mikania micrantha TaxID=192012 RepID=A0A5N6NSR0_9ASTR|nr:hypothetical protein E3N88_17550 [Mikania micrantha]
MVHKHAFEALDRTMKDIFNSGTSVNSDIPFGGKVIVFGGDFRQILPVVPNGGRQEIVNASLSSSYLWEKCKLLRLTRNMRLTIGALASDIEHTNNFAKWLLDIGEGKVGGINDGEAIIEIPDDLLITQCADPIQSLIDFVYPSILQNFESPDFFRERAILAPTNEVVQEINERFISLFPGDEKDRKNGRPKMRGCPLALREPEARKRAVTGGRWSRVWSSGGGGDWWLKGWTVVKISQGGPNLRLGF